MAQGELTKFTIIRNGQEIDHPELVGTKNQLQAFGANYQTIMVGAQGALGVATTANTPLSIFRVMSGCTLDWSSSTGTLSRVTGSQLLNQNSSGIPIILTSNGLIGQGSPSGTTATNCYWYSLSNGTGNPPVPHYSSFSGVSAKFMVFPTVWAGVTPTFTVAISGNTATGHLWKTTTGTTTAMAADAQIKSVSVGTRASDTAMSNCYSQIVLPTPVDVMAGDQITLSYSVSAFALSAYYGMDKTISEYVQGWPFRYPVTGLSGNGTNVTIAVASTPLMHLLSGDRIVVEAVPLKKAITSVTSDPSTWTVTATAHGLTPGNSIVHENITNAAYNGSFVVATAPDANTYTVANASNPGASSGGTVRLATPGSYFSGEYTALCSTATTLVYANTTTGPAPDLTTAILTSPDRCKIYAWNPRQANTTFNNVTFFMQRANQISAVPLPAQTNYQQGYDLASLGYIWGTTMSVTGGSISLGVNTTPTSGGDTSNVNGFNRIKRLNVTAAAGAINTAMGSTGTVVMELEVPQVKHQGYSLTFYPLMPPWRLFAQVPDYASAGM